MAADRINRRWGLQVADYRAENAMNRRENYVSAATRAMACAPLHGGDPHVAAEGSDQGLGGCEAGCVRDISQPVMTLHERCADRLDPAFEQVLMWAGGEVPAKRGVHVTQRQASVLGQLGEIEFLGVATIQDAHDLSELRRQRSMAIALFPDLRLQQQVCVNEGTQYGLIHPLIGDHAANLLSKRRDFSRIFPARKSRCGSLGGGADIEIHSQTLKRIVDVVAADGPVAGDVPDQAAGGNFDPIVLVLYPAATFGDQLNALLAQAYLVIAQVLTWGGDIGHGKIEPTQMGEWLHPILRVDMKADKYGDTIST